MKKLFTLLLLISCSLRSYSWEYVRNRGYLIRFKERWFFQPAYEPTGILKSLNKASFEIYPGQCGLNSLLYSLDDSLNTFQLTDVKYKDIEDGYVAEHSGQLYYVYCELEYGSTSSPLTLACFYFIMDGERECCLQGLNFQASLNNNYFKRL